MFFSTSNWQAMRALAASHEAQWLLTHDPARITEHLEGMRAENPVFAELVCAELMRRRNYANSNPKEPQCEQRAGDVLPQHAVNIEFSVAVPKDSDKPRDTR